MNGDLFGHVEPPPLLVRLDRTCDREQPCCGDIATVRVRSDTIHAAELRCAGCDRHRGWLPRQALDFITSVTKRFGAAGAPITLRDSSIGDREMEKKFDDTNRGALFRDDNKSKDTDRDYSGILDVDGREFWMSGWLKTSKKGIKYLSIAIKPKDEIDKTKPKASRADEMSDEIPF